MLLQHLLWAILPLFKYIITHRAYINDYYCCQSSAADYYRSVLLPSLYSDFCVQRIVICVLTLGPHSLLSLLLNSRYIAIFFIIVNNYNAVPMRGIHLDLQPLTPEVRLLDTKSISCTDNILLKRLRTFRILKLLSFSSSSMIIFCWERS